MCMSMQALLILTLKTSCHNIKLLDQTLTQAITTGLINNLRTWNTVLGAYSKSPIPIKTILLYNYFTSSNSTQPDKFTFPVLLNACTSLLASAEGKKLHAHVQKKGLHSDIYVHNALVHFYGSTGQLADARLLFDNMPQRDATTWNTLLTALGISPSSRVDVLLLFRSLLREGAKADSISLIIVLSACARIANALKYGRTVHSYIIKAGCSSSKSKLENALMGLYAKGGDMDGALKLFNKMNGRKDVVSFTILINGYIRTGSIDLAHRIFDQTMNKDHILWNTIIHGYIKAKQPEEALKLFKNMEDLKLKPDETTMVSVLAACASLADLHSGRFAHRFVLQNNIKQDVFVGTALIDMYSKCGSLKEAMITFMGMEVKDVFTWTTIIEGLANFGYVKEALSLFFQMEKQGIKPNEATFVSVLTACKQSGLVNEGCYLFKRMLVFYKIQPKIKHFGCIVDLLGKAGLLHQAQEFINIMPSQESVVIAYKTLLSACISYSQVDQGLRIADELERMGSHSHDIYIVLSNFYAMAGQWARVADTRRIIKELDMRKEQGISSTYNN